MMLQLAVGHQVWRCFQYVLCGCVARSTVLNHEPVISVGLVAAHLRQGFVCRHRLMFQR